MTKEEELLNYLKVASYNCLSEKSPITKVELSRRILKEGNCDCSEELKTNVRIYKKKAIQSIINIERKIDNLKEKIESAFYKYADDCTILLFKLFCIAVWHKVSSINDFLNLLLGTPDGR